MNDPNKRGMVDAVGPLYPNYVKSIDIFHCPMDWQREDQQFQGRGQVYIDDPNRADHYLVTYPDPVDPNKSYTAYQYDSYSGQFGQRYNQTQAGWEVDTAAYEGRYFLLRGDASNVPVGSPHYKRQLRFRNPPADTVVTWCGFHRDYSTKNGTIWTLKKGSIDIVLFLDGSAKPINSELVLQGVGPNNLQGFVEP
jgi:hypothetical protein